MDMSSQSIEKLFACDARWSEAIWPIKTPKHTQTWKEERRKSEFKIWDLHVEAVLRWLFSWRRQIGEGGREGRVGDVHEVVPPSSDSFFNRSLLESPHVPHFNVFFPVVSTDFPLVTHVKSWKKQQL